MKVRVMKLSAVSDLRTKCVLLGIRVTTLQLHTETSVDPLVEMNETRELTNGFGVPWPVAPVFRGSTTRTSSIDSFDAYVGDVEFQLNFEDDSWNLSNLNPSGRILGR